MPALLLAFALAAQTAAAPPPRAPVTAAVNPGSAPTDDFGFVAWCAGAVEGYLKLKPDVMPEVRRIESRFRRPGSSLAEDMQDYADMEKDARRQMLVYQRAIQAAEKASPTSISDHGQEGYNRGLSVWAAPAGSTRARIAQEWMSWSLPAKCETTAKALTSRSSLFGEALKPSADALSPTPASTNSTDPVVAAAAPADSAAPGGEPAASTPAKTPAKAKRVVSRRTKRPAAQ